MSAAAATLAEVKYAPLAGSETRSCNDDKKALRGRSSAAPLPPAAMLRLVPRGVQPE